jgi:hypothetical protein
MKNQRPVSDVRIGKQKIYTAAVGDTWDPAWADDGKLYFGGNDGSGWNKACGNNLFFNRASGEDAFNLTGETINCLADYGGWAKEGPDGCTWKSGGTLSLDGVLYYSIARHMYGTKSGDPYRRQTASRASIIKSEDRGLTWDRTAQQNYDEPMFPDGRFATPYFIHYGQDGRTHDADGSDRFVYAISNNGFWCNGDNYILGRVAKDRIGSLNAADWQFYSGGDGSADESWSSDCHQAALIIDNPRKCGETGATYVPSLGRYILVAWYYPGDPNIETDETCFIFYESPKPWGPWTSIYKYTSRPEGWYCPRVLSKWQTPDEDEVRCVLVTGGDYYEMSRYYFFTAVEVGLKTGGFYRPAPPEPEPVRVVHRDAGEDLNQFRYFGEWQVHANRHHALFGSEQGSDQPGDYFTFTFEGKRVCWRASKENHMGIAAVSIDDSEEMMVDQWTYCIVPQYRRLLFDSGILPAGKHTFKVRVTGEKNSHAKGNLIYNDYVEVYR